jgi:hypothetical protein
MAIKVYIGLITNQGEETNISELTSVSKYFDGLAAVYHGDKDKGYDILNERKGSGFVVQREFYSHHSHSMNDFLLNPKLEVGSWILLRDSCERVNEDFAKDLKNFLALLEVNGINTVYNYSKLLLFKKFEHQIFFGSPHWGLQGAQPGHIALEQQGLFKSEEEYCYSVRGKVRPEHHFIDHFVKYYLYDSSNHLLLDFPKQDEFLKQENNRIQFKNFCRNELGLSLTVDSLRKYLTENTINDKMKAFINESRILSDFYRFHKLGHTVKDIKDNTSFKL